jgi:hypothetical protein
LLLRTIEIFVYFRTQVSILCTRLVYSYKGDGRLYASQSFHILHVRFTPKSRHVVQLGTSAKCQKRTSRHLFDHLVGSL